MRLGHKFQGGDLFLERMVVVVFDTKSQAYDGVLALKQLDRDKAVWVFAGSVVGKNSDGTVKMLKSQEDFPMREIEGTAMGSLITLLGRPVGAFVGAPLDAFYDLYRSGVNAEFVDDVLSKLLPGKYAVVADIKEDWTSPLDIKMTNLGGHVFRVEKHYPEIDQIIARIAELSVEIEQLDKEIKNSRGEQKAKLKATIKKLNERRQKKVEIARERLELMEKERDIRVGALKEKAAKARGETKAVIEAQVAQINKDYQEILKKLKDLEAERLEKRTSELEEKAKKLRSQTT
jgi:uncharacterized membrane protein